jgi:hypothetical protein
MDNKMTYHFFNVIRCQGLISWLRLLWSPWSFEIVLFDAEIEVLVQR